MKKTLIILLLIVIGGAGLYFYNNRDMFRSEDTISIVGTEERLVKGLKIYAIIDKSRSAEYKNGAWYDEKGFPAKLVVDGTNTFPIPKEYQHADFYFTLGDSLYNYIRMEKESRSMAFDYQFQLTPQDSSYVITGAGLRYDRKKINFQNWRLNRIYSGKIKITDTGNDNGTKIENGN